ncbi:MAG: hypothetical protein D9V47_05145 [Clostridia bacterium]|nr:MAG: hypothetical protein D9V47_05145 [Clostridia bacterium]
MRPWGWGSRPHGGDISEGRILPGIKESNGSFGEASGYYITIDEGRVIEVTAITHRHNPV